MRNNKDIVIAAVSENAFALKYASDSLKNNLEVVKKAISKNIHSLQFASI